MGGWCSNIVCRQHNPVGTLQMDVYLGRGHVDLPILGPSRAEEDGAEMAGQDRACNRVAYAAIVWSEFPMHQGTAHKYH